MQIEPEATDVDEFSDQSIEHSSHGVDMISLEPEVRLTYEDFVGH